MSRYSNLFKTLADCNDTRSQLWAIASATLLIARMLDGWIEGDPPVTPGALKKLNQAIIRIDDKELGEIMVSARNAMLNAPRRTRASIPAMVTPLEELARRLDRWPERDMAADVRGVIQRAIEAS